MSEKQLYKDKKNGLGYAKKKFAKLHQFKLFAEDIVNSIRHPLLVMESDLKVIFANHSFYKAFKTKQEDTEGRFLFDLGNKQFNIPRLLQLLEETVARCTEFENFEIGHDFKNIGKRVLYINARKLDRVVDQHKFILLGMEDVTERIHMERDLNKYRNHLEELIELKTRQLFEVNKNLTEEKERLNVTLRSLGDAVIATDIEGKITLINDAAGNFIGWSSKDVIGKSLSDVLNVVNEKNREPYANLVEKIIKSRGFLNIPKDSILISKSGRERRISDSCSLIRDNKGKITGTVIVFHDITEEKKMEEQLRQSQKMESIGTLAGGIAHDFNNILFAIMGYTDLVKLKLADDAEIFPHLKKIDIACNRAKDLVQQILTFSRQAEQVFKPIEISSVLKEAIRFLKSSLPTTIKIHTNINSDSKIIADATQIYQVIYNLCINAAQAQPEERGMINVALEDFDIDKNYSEKHPGLNPGTYVKLSVEDSGYGISSEILNKIFDPYFTTKQIGRGTGMGLAVVHGIIKNHEGVVSVVSEPGKGTTFDVYFPAIKRKDSRLIEATPFELFPTGHERILVVDDEEPIAQLECQLLEKLGYKITAQTNSNSAFEIFCSSPNNFDLVITDMTMPQMTGYQLVKKIKKIRPDIPIILCSGYNDYISKEKTKELGISAFVLKPITMRDLSKITRKVLDRKKIERRQSERFKIIEKAIAIPKSEPVEEYNIVDISWGGLAISSLVMEEFDQQFNELAIHVVDKSILLDKVPCKIISYSDLAQDLSSDYKMRKNRRSVQFGKLSYSQLNVLDHLICNFTVLH